MASKSAQPEAEKVDVEDLLDYIDKTMERLKTLYEQYFLGMQKQAPAHIHNDIERRIRDLMQVQIRNTGLRYRFATLQQKFGSYNSYWRRTLGQIERGTYIRQLQKIGRKAAQSGEEIPEEILAAMPKRMREQVKRDREQALAIAARRRQAAGDGEVDVDLDSDFIMTFGAPTPDEPAAQVKNQRKHQHVLSEDDGDLDIDAFFASMSGGDDTNPDAKAFPSVEEDDEPTGFTAGPPPKHTPAVPQRQSTPAMAPRPAPPQPQPQRASQPVIPAQPDPRASQPAIPQQQRPPVPGQRPSQPVMAQPPQRPMTLPSQNQQQARPTTLPSQRGGLQTPARGQPQVPQPQTPYTQAAPTPPLPTSGVKFVAPQRAGTVPGVTPAPPQRNSGPIPTPPPPARMPTAPSQVTRPNPIAPGASQQRAATPVESMQGPFPRAPTQTPPAANPVVPRPAPPRPSGARTPPPEITAPPLRPPPGMNDADVNALYAKYVKAKQAVGEDAGPGAYGKLLKTINSQAPKIMEQYKAKGVEFSIVVKDNQVIIKAKPKP